MANTATQHGVNDMYSRVNITRPNGTKQTIVLPTRMAKEHAAAVRLASVFAFNVVKVVPATVAEYAADSGE